MLYILISFFVFDKQKVFSSEMCIKLLKAFSFLTKVSSFLNQQVKIFLNHFYCNLTFSTFVPWNHNFVQYFSQSNHFKYKQFYIYDWLKFRQNHDPMKQV